MNEWNEKKIGECIDLVSGFAFKSTNFLDKKGKNTFPVIKIRNVANGDVNLDNVVYHKYVESLSKYVLTKGDILIAMTGNHPQAQTQVVGEVSRYKLEATSLLNQRVGKFIAKKGTDINFIYYLFKNPEVKLLLANKSSGSANQANISKGDILSLTLKIPSYPEQKSIAEVLTSLDDKIDLLHLQNKTLEQLTETLFKRWFVEKMSQGEIHRLGDVISIYDNRRVPISKMERDKMKMGTLYPYYGAATIMDYINQYIFDGEYVLMGEDGTVQTADGFPILQLPTGKFWVNNHAHIFQAKAPFSNFFIYILLKQTNISGIVTGAVQPKINQEGLKGIQFSIPSKEKVNEFVLITNDYWKKIKSNTHQIRTLTEMRDTLLPKLMSGEITIKTA